MGMCALSEDFARQSVDVMKRAMKDFKDKVEKQMENLNELRQGPQRQLKRIQAVIKIIQSLNEQVGSFFSYFKQQKTPIHFAYSINTINSVLNDIWKDHNESLSTVTKLEQRAQYWMKQVKNSKEHKDSFRINTQMNSTTDEKSSFIFKSDKANEIEGLNLKIQTLRAVIKKNQNQKVLYEANSKQKQQQLIQQNMKHRQEINELSLKLTIANSQMTDQAPISSKAQQHGKKIGSHEIRLLELQKRLKQKAQKQDLLSRKIQRLEEEKSQLQNKISQIEKEKVNLEKRVKELSSQPPTETPDPSAFGIFSLEEQYRADNEILKNRLRDAKDELARLKNQQQKQALNSGSLQFQSIQKAQQEIQQLKMAKLKLQLTISKNQRTIQDLQLATNSLKSKIKDLSEVKNLYELKLLHYKGSIVQLQNKSPPQVNLIDNLSSETKSKNEQITKKDDQIKHLKAQLKNISQQLYLKSEEYEFDCMELQSVRAQMQTMTEQLKKTEESLTNADGKRIKRENQIFFLKESLSQKERELSGVNNDLRNLREQLAKVNSQ